MPVKIACPKCSKNYTLPDTALGKAVKCKECGTAFRTKMPGGASAPGKATNAARPTSPQRARPAQRAPARPASPNPNEFGLDGGFEKQADIFGSATQGSAGLQNVSDKDPFGDAVDPIVLGPAGASTAPAENPYQSVMTNTSMRGSSVRKKATKKKRSQTGSKSVAGYEKVRIGMTLVFWAGAAMLVCSFISFAFAMMVQAIAAFTSGPPSEFMLGISKVLGFITLGVTSIGWLVFAVGHIMCMFSPAANEKFSSITSAVLWFVSVSGFVVGGLVMGLSFGNMSQGTLIVSSIGIILVTFICGAIGIAAMFLFVNFYRAVGKNVKSDRLVQSSNLVTIALVGVLVFPIFTGVLLFVLKSMTMEPQTRITIFTTVLCINVLYNFGVFALTVKMVRDGVTSLRPS